MAAVYSSKLVHAIQRAGLTVTDFDRLAREGQPAPILRGVATFASVCPDRQCRRPIAPGEPIAAAVAVNRAGGLRSRWVCPACAERDAAAGTHPEAPRI